MGQRASVSEYATVRVCLDSPASVPGDVVSGEISAVVIAKTRLSEVNARLRCTLVTAVDADHGKDVLVDQNIVCKKFNSGYIEPGSYKFPFRFHLPRNAPPSSEFEHADHGAGSVVKVSVAYKVSAEVRGGGGASGWFSSKQVAHVQPLEVNAVPTVSTVATGTMAAKVDSGFSFFRTHGGIQARGFCLPSCVRPGEKCAVTVYLRNSTNAAFVLRHVKLEQRVMARTRLRSKEHTQKWVLHHSATHETEEEWQDPNDNSQDSGASGATSTTGATGATSAKTAGPSPGSTAAAASSTSAKTVAGDEKDKNGPKSKKGPRPAPPTPRKADFGAKNKGTCSRFSVTIPLNIRHQSFVLEKASVTHALVFTLQPCTFFGQNYHLRLPIQIALANEAPAHDNSSSIPANTEGINHSVPSAAVHGDHDDHIPMAEPVAAPTPTPSAPPFASVAASAGTAAKR